MPAQIKHPIGPHRQHHRTRSLVFPTRTALVQEVAPHRQRNQFPPRCFHVGSMLFTRRFPSVLCRLYVKKCRFYVGFMSVISEHFGLNPCQSSRRAGQHNF